MLSSLALTRVLYYVSYSKVAHSHKCVLGMEQAAPQHVVVFKIQIDYNTGMQNQIE